MKEFFITKYKIVFLFLLFTSVLSAQKIEQIAVISKEGTRYIASYVREGTVYFSVTGFADAASINYFLNSQTDKIELKFSNYYLKITASNPFIVLTNTNNNEQRTFQLPTSSYVVNNQIFVPLDYSLNLFKVALGKELLFNGKDRLVVKEEKPSIGIEDIEKNNIPFRKYSVTGIILEEKVNGTLVRVLSDKKIPSYASSFKDGILTIIFRNANGDINKINKTKPEGLITKVTSRNIKSDIEFKFYLKSNYTTNEVLNANEGDDILITLHNKIFARNEELEKSKERWDFDVVVIDAGHGGHDSGAIGIGGVKEKDINLAIALKLGKLIEKNINGVKVVYTRKTDKFVELYKRGKIANENNGKLFISIHCNSTPHKPTDANGTEVYLLRPGRTKEAIQIAERENSVIQYEDNPQRYQKLTDENFILVSMAHSAYMKYSEKFSDYLNKEFVGDRDINSRGIKQAGFYVLVGASMPSVLVETGFISNRHDAAFLKSSKGQNEIANSIYKAVKEYKKHYEKVIQTEL